MSDPSLKALGQALRSDLERHAEPDRVSAARLRHLVLVDRHAARSARPWLGYALGALAAPLCVVVALLLWPGTAEQPLRFWVEERTGQIDEWVTAREVEQSLRFSDGSSIIVGPSTTTRVMQVLPEGARLTLERGQLDAHVVHREASRWQVAAGPFVVHVTGTRFRVTWDPQAETLAVKVSEGRVEVTGGGHPKHELAAGSDLSLHVAGASLKSATLAGDTPNAAASAEPGSATTSARDEDELIRAPKGGEPQRQDWRELSTSGRYREALASVEQQGFVTQCESLSARDLLTLGSTARLAGRSERASEAYLAARRRFPSSSEAAISAFSLGRLASDAGRAGTAIAWFERYLAEQPGGQLAREASGRLIEHFRQTGKRTQARAASEQYLKQYPTGPHATLARSVLAQP